MPCILWLFHVLQKLHNFHSNTKVIFATVNKLSCKQCSGSGGICNDGEEGISTECDVCISAKASKSFTERAPFGDCHSVCAKVTNNNDNTTKRYCHQWHGLNENLPQCISQVLKLINY